MKTMVTSRSKFLLLFCSLLFAPCFSAKAQQPSKAATIGYLAAGALATEMDRNEALRQGLRELGYTEGKNITIEWRFAEGKLDRVPALAAELVNLKVDIIVTGGGAATGAAKQATSTIPIVMTQDSDPVGTGYVASLARPGGHITGLTNYAPELTGKRLEILKEIIPKLSRVAVLGTSTVPGSAEMKKELELAAKALKVQLQYFEVRDAKEIDSAFQAAKKARADAVITLVSAIFVAHRSEIAELAAKHRLPATYHFSSFVEDGGLMFYGPSIVDLSRRAATYVDKILKGRTPAEIPVEQPKKFDFIINLKAAKQIGLTIPPNVLARADRVLK